MENKPITIQAGNSENGYAGLSGTIGDLDNVGLNEVVNASNGVGVTV